MPRKIFHAPVVSKRRNAQRKRSRNQEPRRSRASTLASVVQRSLVCCLAALRTKEADEFVDDFVVVQRQRQQHDTHALNEAGRDRRGREDASEHNGQRGGERLEDVVGILDDSSDQ
eukprot:scaffold111783_cov63-Phaeocystis_antarctica.AAC.4